MPFLHALYVPWMAERFPSEVLLSKLALTRRLKVVGRASGRWYYARSRPGSLMSTVEPLAVQVPYWSHDGSDDAIYGSRRTGV